MADAPLSPNAPPNWFNTPQATPPTVAPMGLSDVMAQYVTQPISNAVQGATGWTPGTTPSWMPQWATDLSNSNKAAEAAFFQRQQQYGKLGITPDTLSMLMSMAMPVEAWHGTPHTFDEFSRSAIGTGQGAATYGRGTAYVAEARPVAEQYRNELTWGSSPMMETPEGRMYKDDYLEDLTPSQLALHMAANHGGDAAAAAETVDNLAASGKSLIWDAPARLLRENPGAYEGARWQEPGHLLNVQVDAEPEDFLHWDKQLNQQSPQVRAAIQKITPTPSVDEVGAAQRAEIAAQNRYQDLYAQLKPPGPATHPDFWPQAPGLRRAEQAAIQATNHRQDVENLARGEMTGEDYYEHLVNQSRAAASGPNKIDLSGDAVHQQTASDALEQAGIPGIRYLDQKSRDAKPRDEVETDLADWQDELQRLREQDPDDNFNGPMGHQTELRVAEMKVAQHQQDLDNWTPPTHNYVVFSPDKLKIKGRYGLAGAGLLTGAAGAGAAAMAPSRAQAAQQGQ